MAGTKERNDERGNCLVGWVGLVGRNTFGKALLYPLCCCCWIVLEKNENSTIMLLQLLWCLFTCSLALCLVYGGDERMAMASSLT